MEVFVSFLLWVYDKYSDSCCDYSLKLKKTKYEVIKVMNGQVPFCLLSPQIKIKISTNAISFLFIWGILFLGEGSLYFELLIMTTDVEWMIFMYEQMQTALWV